MLGGQSSLEKPQEGSQADPIHVADLRQIRNDKVEAATDVSQRDVTVPFLV